MSAGVVTFKSEHLGTLHIVGELILQSIDSRTLLIRENNWYRIQQRGFGGATSQYRTRNINHALRNFDVVAAAGVR